MCVSDAILKAKVDGELPDEEQREVQAHLAACSRCSAREKEIAEQTVRVGVLFAGLARSAEAPDAAAAYGRFRTRLAGEPERESGRSWMKWMRLRPVWGVAAALAIVALIAVSSAPARAVAQRLLGLFRVKAVVAVPIDRPEVVADGKGDLLRQVMADSMEAAKEPRELTATTREDASKLAGFDVSLPSLRQDQPQIIVRTEGRFEFTARAERLRTLASTLGRPDLDVPSGLDGAKVVIDLPAGVVARYGECPAESREGHGTSEKLKLDTCLVVMQAPTPVVATMPELNLAPIAEFGLQLAGMTPEQAHTFSSTVDWTSTLAIPVPRNAATFQNVTVGGNPAVLVTSATTRFSNRLPGYGLFWVRNGRIYGVSGFGDSSQAVSIAESLR